MSHLNVAAAYSLFAFSKLARETNKQTTKKTQTHTKKHKEKILCTQRKFGKIQKIEKTPRKSTKTFVFH